jgi:hypothetical protein
MKKVLRRKGTRTSHRSCDQKKYSLFSKNVLSAYYTQGMKLETSIMTRNKRHYILIVLAFIHPFIYSTHVVWAVSMCQVFFPPFWRHGGSNWGLVPLLGRCSTVWATLGSQPCVRYSWTYKGYSGSKQNKRRPSQSLHSVEQCWQ